jgi:hypothetical protein
MNKPNIRYAKFLSMIAQAEMQSDQEVIEKVMEGGLITLLRHLGEEGYIEFFDKNGGLVNRDDGCGFYPERVAGKINIEQRKVLIEEFSELCDVFLAHASGIFHRALRNSGVEDYFTRSPWDIHQDER